MKENKVNIDLIVPSIGKKYNIFLPGNKTIGEIIVILNQTINDLTGCFPLNNKLVLLNVTDAIIYDYNAELINTLGVTNVPTLAIPDGDCCEMITGESNIRAYFEANLKK